MDRGSGVVCVFCLASSGEGKAKHGICRLQLTSAFTNELLYSASILNAESLLSSVSAAGPKGLVERTWEMHLFFRPPNSQQTAQFRRTDGETKSAI